MDNQVENLCISSRNPGYIANLAWVFESSGVPHRFLVDCGLMQIVIQPAWREQANQVLSRFGLLEQTELPAPKFNYLMCLETEELEDVIASPGCWKADEIEAAKQILSIKLEDRKQVMELLTKVPVAVQPDQAILEFPWMGVASHL